MAGHVAKLETIEKENTYLRGREDQIYSVECVLVDFHWAGLENPQTTVLLDDKQQRWLENRICYISISKSSKRCTTIEWRSKSKTQLFAPKSTVSTRCVLEWLQIDALASSRLEKISSALGFIVNRNSDQENTNPKFLVTLRHWGMWKRTNDERRQTGITSLQILNTLVMNSTTFPHNWTGCVVIRLLKSKLATAKPTDRKAQTR